MGEMVDGGWWMEKRAIAGGQRPAEGEGLAHRFISPISHPPSERGNGTVGREP